MSTTKLYLVIILSVLAVQSLADPNSLLFFLRSTGEGSHSMDVPYVSFDDMAFQSLKSDALSTTTTTSTTTITTQESLPTTNAMEAETTTGPSSSTAKDKPKNKKKRHGRKHRSYMAFY